MAPYRYFLYFISLLVWNAYTLIIAPPPYGIGEYNVLYIPTGQY